MPAATKRTQDNKQKILVIVESPAKAKTINRYLGKDYLVEASMGHVIDLPKSRIAVDPESFEPDYITVRGRGKILNSIKRLAGKSSSVLLAADEDREGEAISFHLMRELKKKYPDLPMRRIVFHEITKSAIQDAISRPREIDQPKVNAQKARRVLDRLVGYNISPILWEKVKKGLSAGRVQSVALRLVCEREEAIRSFVPEEYWEIAITLLSGKHTLQARLLRIDGEKAELRSREAVDRILEELATGTWVCSAVEVRNRSRKPTAPFTTSKLQQAAANLLGFTSDRTMRIAQQLYEGVELEEGSTGLISYMRTDSTRISDLALGQLRDYIKENYGEDELPEGPNQFQNRKGSQDAHEAIRPTDVSRTPDSLKNALNRDQYRLYKLIWSKFVSSQMKPAVYEQTSLDIVNGRCLFRAGGSRLLSKGFLRVFDEPEDEETVAKRLPAVTKGDSLVLQGEPDASQHFTQPPPRYTDASLVKILEESGIGRPSTYAPTISTLIKRYYVVRQGRQLVPSELGRLINDLLVRHFPSLLDIAFTANMEEQLDLIEEESLDWTSLLRDFYGKFKPDLESAASSIDSMKNMFDSSTDRVCETCGRPMIKRLGRFGYFLACSGFPECRNTGPLPLAPCPQEGCDGSLVAKKGKGRRLFYGCTRYKEDGSGCGFVTWDKPVDRPCPQCGALLIERNTREAGFQIACAKCEYRERGEG